MLLTALVSLPVLMAQTGRHLQALKATGFWLPKVLAEDLQFLQSRLGAS